MNSPMLPAISRYHMITTHLTNLKTLRRVPFTRCFASSNSEVYEFQVAPEHIKAEKIRLDAYLANQIPTCSRARLQASIKEGLVAVNGKLQGKASAVVRSGDIIRCSIIPPPPLEALPEALPLDIVFEDDHVLVINKARDMVVHPSPGHYTGTLVNALLHHCGLPSVKLIPTEDDGALSEGTDIDSDLDDDDYDYTTEEINGNSSGGGSSIGNNVNNNISLPAMQSVTGGLVESISRHSNTETSSTRSTTNNNNGSSVVIRPGIVHRLDKGTTGLMIVAKTDIAHASLATQFKDKTIQRAYMSLMLGVPSPKKGRVTTNIGRDLRDRKKMAAFSYGCNTGRLAASNYQVTEIFGEESASLVEWRLETGRTHQIRVHAKHTGHPLVGDDMYGGLSVGSIKGGKDVQKAVGVIGSQLGRPALHSWSLKFEHPVTGKEVVLECPPPEDFLTAASSLRELSR